MRWTSMNLKKPAHPEAETQPRDRVRRIEKQMEG
jgi:hypothetical protein